MSALMSALAANEHTLGRFEIDRDEAVAGGARPLGGGAR